MRDVITIPSLSLSLGCRSCLWAQPAFTVLLFAKKMILQVICRVACLPNCLPVTHLIPCMPSWVCWQQLPGCCQLGMMCFSNRDPATPLQQTQNPCTCLQSLQILD